MAPKEAQRPVESIHPNFSIDALVLEITKKPHLFTMPLEKGDILQVRITGYQEAGKEPAVYDLPLPLYKIGFYSEKGFEIEPYFSIRVPAEKAKLPESVREIVNKNAEKIYVQVAHHMKNNTELKQFMDAGNDFYSQLVPDSVNELAKSEEGTIFFQDIHKSISKDTTVFLYLAKKSDELKKQEEKRKKFLKKGLSRRAEFEP